MSQNLPGRARRPDYRNPAAQILKRGPAVLDKRAAREQITAEKILQEAYELNAAAKPERAPDVLITDPEELALYRARERKELEMKARRDYAALAVWTRYAQWEQSQGSMPNARSVLERAVAHHGRNKEFWKAYARLESRFGDLNMARNVWERAVTALPDVPELWMQYLLLEHHAHGDVACRDLFNRWLAFLPGAFAWKLFVRFELSVMEFARARALLQRLVMESNTPASWLFYAGVEASALGDAGQAAAVLRTALEALPAADALDPRLHLALASLLERLGRVSEARKCFEAVLNVLSTQQDLHQRRQQPHQQQQKQQQQQQQQPIIDAAATEAALTVLVPAYTAFENVHGGAERTAALTAAKRAAFYEQSLAARPCDGETWKCLAELTLAAAAAGMPPTAASADANAAADAAEAADAVEAGGDGDDVARDDPWRAGSLSVHRRALRFCTTGDALAFHAMSERLSQEQQRRLWAPFAALAVEHARLLREPPFGCDAAADASSVAVGGGGGAAAAEQRRQRRLRAARGVLERFRRAAPTASAFPDVCVAAAEAAAAAGAPDACRDIVDEALASGAASPAVFRAALRIERGLLDAAAGPSNNNTANNNAAAVAKAPPRAASVFFAHRVRALYEAALKAWPSDAALWAEFASLEADASEFVRAEALLRMGLAAVEAAAEGGATTPAVAAAAQDSLWAALLRTRLRRRDIAGARALYRELAAARLADFAAAATPAPREGRRLAQAVEAAAAFERGVDAEGGVAAARAWLKSLAEDGRRKYGAVAVAPVLEEWRRFERAAGDAESLAAVDHVAEAPQRKRTALFKRQRTEAPPS